VGGGQCDADQRQSEAENLRKRNAGAKEDEIEQEDQHRNAGLLDCDIDRRRIFYRRVEHGVEERVADDAVEEEQRQVLPDDRPVAFQLRHEISGNQRRCEEPAQRGQHRVAFPKTKFYRCAGLSRVRKSAFNRKT
jgi:hypothetical protein